LNPISSETAASLSGLRPTIMRPSPEAMACQDPVGSDRKRIMKNKNLRVIEDKIDKLQELN
jgi:hypothetical protein